jgi:hypothetical protein
MLINQAHKLCSEVGPYEEMDPVFMGQALEENFDRDMLFKLMTTEFGRGMIMGIYMNEKARLDEAIDEEAMLGEEG